MLAVEPNYHSNEMIPKAPIEGWCLLRMLALTWLCCGTALAAARLLAITTDCDDQY